MDQQQTKLYKYDETTDIALFVCTSMWCIGDSG